MDSTSDIEADMRVSGTGIPYGATVEEVTDSTHIELSSAALANGTNVTLTFKTLTRTEELIYNAELSFARAEFMKVFGRKELYKRKSYRESVSQDGVTRSNSGISGRMMSAADHIREGKEYLIAAGYVPTSRLMRGDSIFYGNTVIYYPGSRS